MFGHSRGDRVLQIITGRRILTYIHERNYKMLGVDEDEDRKIPCHGNFEGTV